MAKRILRCFAVCRRHRLLLPKQIFQVKINKLGVFGKVPVPRCFNKLTPYFAMLEKDEREITIADLYPELSSEQQIEARENWLRYLAVVKRIFEHICAEKPEVLTELERRAMLRKKENRDI